MMSFSGSRGMTDEEFETELMRAMTEPLKPEEDADEYVRRIIKHHLERTGFTASS